VNILISLPDLFVFQKWSTLATGYLLKLKVHPRHGVFRSLGDTGFSQHPIDTLFAAKNYLTHSGLTQVTLGHSV